MLAYVKRHHIGLLALFIALGGTTFSPARAHALRLADVEAHVDGVAVLDAREVGDVTCLGCLRAVVADGAAGEREAATAAGMRTSERRAEGMAAR